MGGIALLARHLGYQVSGSDQNVYPPMSTQLAEQGITLTEGYDAAQLEPAPDLVVIGNAMSRGNPAVEAVLNMGLPYISGPGFLSQYLLKDRWVLAVAGTHGKTTTSAMLAWVLEHAKLNPGFLIGGIPENFGISARAGDNPFFVVEADEYDTAFFDKRSKFVHYRPRTLIMNNLEFDHADIFPDLDAIKRQFHHLVRIVPGNGLIIAPQDDANIQSVLSMGCWTPVESFALGGGHWSVDQVADDGSSFRVCLQGKPQGTVQWDLLGKHNVLNGLAAIAAARHAGVPVAHGIEGLSHFANVKRRMQIRGTVDGITIYDDFAHHPTAITTTLEGLRHKVGKARILALLEPRSNTMRMGVHKDKLAGSLQAADLVFLYNPPDLGWSLQPVGQQLGRKGRVLSDIETMIKEVTAAARPGDHILIMSNGAFGGVHDKLLKTLQLRGSGKTKQA